MRPHLKILVIEDAVDLLEQITSSIGNTITYFDRSDVEISLLEANSLQRHYNLFVKTVTFKLWYLAGMWWRRLKLQTLCH